MTNDHRTDKESGPAQTGKMARIEAAYIDVFAEFDYGAGASRQSRWDRDADRGREAHDGHDYGCVAGLGY